MTKLEKLKAKYSWSGRGEAASFLNDIAQEHAKVGRGVALDVSRLTLDRAEPKIKAVRGNGATIKMPVIDLNDYKDQTDAITKTTKETLKGLKDKIKANIFAGLIDKHGVKKKLTKAELKKAVQIARDTIAGYKKKVKGRSIIGDIASNIVFGMIEATKKAFYKKASSLNGWKTKKQWQHRPWLSVVPRKGHAMMHGKMVELHETFRVPNVYSTKHGWKIDNWDSMDRPHDPKAPLEQVINCKCMANYIIET